MRQWLRARLNETGVRVLVVQAFTEATTEANLDHDDRRT
jgi:hypothetical protein